MKSSVSFRCLLRGALPAAIALFAGNGLRADERLFTYVQEAEVLPRGELEEKLVLQKNFAEKWVAAFNVTLEQEWAFTSGDTEEELTLELTAGLAYKINSNWSVGLEGRNHRVFAPGLNFGNQEANAWFVGPTVDFARSRGWA